MSTISVTMSSEEAALWAGLQRIARGAEDVEKGFSKAAASSKKLTAEQQALEKAAKKVFDETRTPQERHNRRMEELNALVKKGAIDQETYGRAVRKAQDELRGAGKAGEQAFGAGAISQLKSYAAGFVSLSAAIGTAKQLLQQYNALKVEGAAEVAQAVPGRAKLAELAGGDVARMGHILTVQQEVQRMGFTSEQASELAFELISGSLAEEAPLFGKLYHHQPARLAAAAGTMRKAFGAAETGSAEAIVSKAFAAAAPAVGVSAVDLAKETAGVAASAAALGLTDEETMAALSLLAERAGSASEAGTQLGSLFTALRRQGFAEQYGGKGLGAMLAAIGAEGMDEPALISFLGRAEAAKAFGGLDLAELGERTGEIQAAQKRNLVSDILKTEEMVPGLPEERQLRIAEQAKALGLTPLGVQQTGAEAWIKQVQAGLSEREMYYDAMLEGAFMRWEKFIWGEEKAMGVWAERHPQIATKMEAEPETSNALLQAARELSAAAADLKRPAPVLAQPDVDK